jgi:single-strand DNA-binding protein
LASFGVAVSKRRKTDDGKWVDDGAEFFDVTCWKDLAENVASSIEKGTRVIVTGRLQQRSWEKDGEKKSKVEIVADEVGPSLRWATAGVEKTERRTADLPKPLPAEEVF